MCPWAGDSSPRSRARGTRFRYLLLGVAEALAGVFIFSQRLCVHARRRGVRHLRPSVESSRRCSRFLRCDTQRLREESKKKKKEKSRCEQRLFREAVKRSASRVADMSAECHRTSGSRSLDSLSVPLGSRSTAPKPCFSIPGASFVALRLAVVAGAVPRPDVERVSGHVCRLHRIDAPAGCERSSRSRAGCAASPCRALLSLPPSRSRVGRCGATRRRAPRCSAIVASRSGG